MCVVGVVGVVCIVLAVVSAVLLYMSCVWVACVVWKRVKVLQPPTASL